MVASLAEPAATPLLQVDQLSVTYRGGRVALASLSFEVLAGESLAIIGPNGAGKTSLLRSLLNLTPYTGQIHWRIPRQAVGYVPQTLYFDRHFPITVLEFLATALPKHSLVGWRSPLRQAALKALQRVGMAAVIDQMLGDLSGGERQRVMVAHALCQPRQVLVLDEPLQAIDAAGADDFCQLLQSLKQEGMTLVMVSHDVGLVSQWADRVLCINRSLLWMGAPLTVMTPANLYAAYGQTILL